MAESLTYTSLVTDVEAYSERTDTNFVSQIPRFVMLAENKIASELKILGFQEPVTGVIAPNANTLSKPTFWRDNISFNITLATGERVELLPRAYEYCRNFWPNPTLTAQPRFYSDYDANNFLIVPTPDVQYNFELLYYARLQPLDITASTNWMTRNIPQTLFYAVMIEAQTFLKNMEKTQYWQGLYDRSMSAVNGENQKHMSDRTTENA